MMTEQKDNRCPTEFIRDTPSEEDYFNSQSHKKIAITLRDIILEKEGGITIGIAGNYGSGKSTIITILQNLLNVNKNNNIKFFTFDAWAHEGNLMRMIFLENLILELKSGKKQ
nr:P-loop NTPase fold protein [uncultured Hyphomonas sp.]